MPTASLVAQNVCRLPTCSSWLLCLHCCHLPDDVLLMAIGWWSDFQAPPQGIAIGVDTFGASAPGPALYDEFGITTKNMVAKAKSLLGL